jgi:glycerate kinase
VSRLLAAPDKFRGTATAGEAADAMIEAARSAGWDAQAVPVSDGGEGLLDCFGGANRHAVVTGPLGALVEAGWRLDGDRAVIEMATASGLALLTGPNDPLAATTRGTGELIRAALDAGAQTVIVGAGGSATTDGGEGAVEVLRDRAPLDGSHGARVVVATDVHTRFVDAAVTFAPQKGADDAQVAELSARLELLADRYAADFGVPVRDLAGSGAAGGLAGGLAALGAAVRPGFELVAEQLDLPRAVAGADLVVTGEGRLDATSLAGKATGSVVALCGRLGVPVVAVVGHIAAGFAAPFRTVDLTETYGDLPARKETVNCIRAAVCALLAEPTR